MVWTGYVVRCVIGLLRQLFVRIKCRVVLNTQCQCYQVFQALIMSSISVLTLEYLDLSTMHSFCSSCGCFFVVTLS